MQDEIRKPAADIERMLDRWSVADALVKGADAVRAMGQKLLPKLPEESEDAYNFRLKVAKYTNIYADILEGLASKPFAEEVAISEAERVSENITRLVEDIDGAGNNLTVFAANVFYDAINKGIDWIYIDYPVAPVDGRRRSVAEERVLGLRPFWNRIRAENVLEVRESKFGGNRVISYFRFVYFGNDGKERVRVMQRDEQRAWYEVYAKDEDTDKWFVEQEGAITINIIPVVPFITGKREGSTWEVRLPMQGALDLQRELYQQESDLKYAKKLTCYPMLTGQGVAPPETGSVQAGPHRVLYAPPNDDGSAGRWEWLEVSAESLRFLAEDIKETIRQLRELGRQPLTAQSGNLTVVTTAFAAAKGNSAVQQWALALKDALEQAFVITALWLREPPEVTIHVYKDFPTGDEDHNDFTHVLQMRQSGDLSQETVWAEGKRRGILGDEFDNENERERILAEIPADNDDDLTASIGINSLPRDVG